MKNNSFQETTRYLFFALTVLSIVLLTAGSLVWADARIKTGNLGIGSGSIIVVTCLYISYILLDIGLFIDERSDKFAKWIFTLGAILPAIISAIGIGLTTSTVLIRLLLIITAGLLGIGSNRVWKTVLRNFNLTRFYKVDLIRQGIAMLIVGIMSLIYVSMPILQINILP